MGGAKTLVGIEMCINILLADNQRMVCEGIGSLLEKEPGIKASAPVTVINLTEITIN